MFRNNFLKFDYKTCSSGYAINPIRAWNKIYIYIYIYISSLQDYIPLKAHIRYN